MTPVLAQESNHRTLGYTDKKRHHRDAAGSLRFNNDPGASRTRVLRIKSPLLYRLSYRVTRLGEWKVIRWHVRIKASASGFVVIDPTVSLASAQLSGESAGSPSSAGKRYVFCYSSIIRSFGGCNTLIRRG
jgi:hypothetical protein